MSTVQAEAKTTRLPLIYGYIVGKTGLVIVACPFCGGVHHHSNNNYIPGTLTTRVPHCHNTSIKNICILVRGHMDVSYFNQRYSQRKPSKKRIHEPKYIDFPIEKIGED